MWLNILLLVILVLIGLYLFARRRGLISAPPGMNAAATDDELSGRMTPGQLQIVVAYLLFLGISLIYMEVSLLSLEFPDPPPTLSTPTVTSSGSQPLQLQTDGTSQPAAPEGDAAAQKSPTPPPPPTIVAAMPQPPNTASEGEFVTVYGMNFSNESQVRLNGRVATTKQSSATSITASLTPADVVNGQVAIEVVDGGGRISNAVVLGLPARKPTVKLNVLNWWKPDINREVQLLLIIVFAGALGSYIHALKSATAFIGNGTMKSSWFWWYVSGPFVGMAMSLVFYCVLRGGFLAGTPADEKVVNPFGVLAVGALVGMFADKAALKLGEIFETLFKSGDPRGDRLNAPVIISLEPNKIQAGTNSQMVKMIGERLAKVNVVRFDGTDVKAEVLSDREVHFTLEKKDLEKPRTLKVAAVDAQGGASISATLAIVGPKITLPADPLPAATVNTPYDQAISAVDCAGTCHWSLRGNAGGLAIDPASGRLTGTPQAAGTLSFTIAVEDDNHVTDEKSVELVVN